MHRKAARTLILGCLAALAALAPREGGAQKVIRRAGEQSAPAVRADPGVDLRDHPRLEDPRWELMTINEEYQTRDYLDTRTITRTPTGTVRAWIYRVYLVPQNFGDAPVDVSLHQDEFRCASRESRTLEYNLYYRGDRVHSWRVDASEWASALPGTIAETQLERVCAGAP